MLPLTHITWHIMTRSQHIINWKGSETDCDLLHGIIQVSAEHSQENHECRLGLSVSKPGFKQIPPKYTSKA